MRPIRNVAALICAGAIVAITACNATAPNPQDIGKSVTISRQGTSAVATISPWPLDNSIAFMCLKNPGADFSVDKLVPPAAAGCVALDVSVAGDRLTATLNSTKIGLDKAAAFEAQDPWYIAFAGSRGPVSVATSVLIPRPAVPSDAGPS
ncbi:MAG TPA: hypothetical protein VGQ64_07680 [Candidatus Limnocylindrales bacterium]|jgi:hypothetical protein|nr:hypothetical protein [Candidatus Limnocylindrales bacterium]